MLLGELDRGYPGGAPWDPQLGVGGKKARLMGKLESDSVQTEASADPRELRSEMTQERSDWGLSPGFLLHPLTSTPASPWRVAVEGRAVALLLRRRDLLEWWEQELWGHCGASPRCAPLPPWKNLPLQLPNTCPSL